MIKSIAIIILLVISLTMTTCYFGDGSGGAGAWIPIRTAEELNAIRTNAQTMSQNYYLVANINLGVAPWNTGEGWEPIGTFDEEFLNFFFDDGVDGFEQPFTGKFNGNGYKITGLTINRPLEFPVGLFGYVKGAEFTNIVLEDVNIAGAISVGSLVGFALNSTITNSYSTGTVTSISLAGSLAGGIAGYLHDSTITNSYSTGNITGRSAGGIVGGARNSTITNSYSTGDIIANGFSAGGIVGYVRDSTITNSYSTGNISAGYCAGGIAGEVSFSSIITNNAAINPSITSFSDAGRIVGDIYDSTVENNFALDTMTVTGGGSFGDDGTDKTNVELRTRITYSNAIIGDGLGGLGWRFGNNDTNPWKWEGTPTDGRPILYWQ